MVAKGHAGVVSEGQVEAMISLLTDDSDAVVDNCRRALLAHSRVAEPMLRERVARDEGDVHVFRGMLEDIRLQGVERELVTLLRGPSDLERGAILIGRLLDRSDAPDTVSASLDAMADQIGAEPGEDPVAVMRDVLVTQNGLKGVDMARAHAIDALLHGVTTRRRGLPLPLCVAWLLVARRTEVPLVGVNMPGHFLIRLERDEGTLLLDPFSKGAVVSADRCKAWLARSGYPSTDLRLLDASDRDMLLRTLRNLVMISTRRENRDHARRFGRILSAVEQPRDIP